MPGIPRYTPIYNNQYGVPYTFSGIDFPSWENTAYSRGKRDVGNATSKANRGLRQFYNKTRSDVSAAQDKAYANSQEAVQSHRDYADEMMNRADKSAKFWAGKGEWLYEDVNQKLGDIYSETKGDLWSVSDVYNNKIFPKIYGTVKGDLVNVKNEAIKRSPLSKLITYNRMLQDTGKYSDIFAQKYGVANYQGYSKVNPAGRRMSLIASNLTKAAQAAANNLITTAANISNKSLLDEYNISSGIYRTLMSGISGLGSSWMGAAGGLGSSLMSGIAGLGRTRMSGVSAAANSLMNLYGRAMSETIGMYKAGLLSDADLTNSLIKQQTSFAKDMASLANTAMAGASSVYSQLPAGIAGLAKQHLNDITTMDVAHQQYLSDLAKSAATEAAAGKSAAASMYNSDLRHQEIMQQLEDADKARLSNIISSKYGLKNLEEGAGVKLDTSLIKTYAKLAANKDLPKPLRDAIISALSKLFGVDNIQTKVFNPQDLNKYLYPQAGSQNSSPAGLGLPGTGYNDTEVTGRTTSLSSNRGSISNNEIPSWVVNTINSGGNLSNTPGGYGAMWDLSTGRVGWIGTGGVPVVKNFPVY